MSIETLIKDYAVNNDLEDLTDTDIESIKQSIECYYKLEYPLFVNTPSLEEFSLTVLHKTINNYFKAGNPYVLDYRAFTPRHPQFFYLPLSIFSETDCIEYYSLYLKKHEIEFLKYDFQQVKNEFQQKGYNTPRTEDYIFKEAILDFVLLYEIERMKNTPLTDLYFSKFKECFYNITLNQQKYFSLGYFMESFYNRNILNLQRKEKILKELHTPLILNRLLKHYDLVQSIQILTEGETEEVSYQQWQDYITSLNKGDKSLESYPTSWWKNLV